MHLFIGVILAALFALAVVTMRGEKPAVRITAALLALMVLYLAVT